MTRGPFNPATTRVQLVTSMAEAMEFLEWVQRPWDLMGIDIESSGLDWYDGKLRLVQFGTTTEGWAIPFERFGQLVIEGLNALNCPIVGHNVKFDLHWLERHAGWRVKDWSMVHDTIVLASLVDSAGPKGLKDLATLYVHPVAKLGETALKDAMKRGGWDWATVPVELEEYWVYGVLDTILTAHLFHELYGRAEKLGLLRAYNTERRTLPVLFAMERNGMLVDGEYCQDQYRKLVLQAEGLEAQAISMGLTNIRSSPQIAKALLDRGVELLERTDSGKYWKMDSDTLEEVTVRTKDPLAQTVVEYRRSLKWATTYFQNFMDYQRSDGRVHPQFRQTQARTHRMSCTDPAMQTIPRAHTDVTVRNAFVARPDHVVVSTDFSNVEVRLFAHHAREQGMLEALREGRDFHLWMARTLYRDDTITKVDHRRDLAKNTLFCCVPDTTKAVTRRGIVSVDDLIIGEDVLSYDQASETTKWTPLLEVVRYGDAPLVELRNGHRAFTSTPNHRWFGTKRTDHGNSGRTYDPCVVTTDNVTVEHRITLAAPLDDSVPDFNVSDDELRLLAWVLTDGSSYEKSGVVTATIVQSKSIGVADICGLVGRNPEWFTPTVLAGVNGCKTWRVRSKWVRKLWGRLGLTIGHEDPTALVLSLSHRQLRLFMDTVYLAEGEIKYLESGARKHGQNTGPFQEALKLGVFLLGFYPTDHVQKTNYPTNKVNVTTRWGRPFVTGQRLQKVSVGSGPVWCPRTAYGSWVAVEGSSIFITGNTIYGGGPAKIAATAGVTLMEAKEAYNRLHSTFPGIKRFQRETVQEATDNERSSGRPFIRLDEDGRILALAPEDDRVYALSNARIQGGAAVAMKRALANLDDLGLSEFLTLTVHDEVVAEVPLEYLQDYMELVQEGMMDLYTYNVPIIAETGDPAERWGEAK